MEFRLQLQALSDLHKRYRAAFRDAWQRRAQKDNQPRTVHEAHFPDSTGRRNTASVGRA